MRNDVGRLALREEGEFWNAYYARPDAMTGAILLGSLKMTLAKRREKHKRAFMVLMCAIVDDLLEETLGVRVASWTEGPAPEHERTKE